MKRDKLTQKIEEIKSKLPEVVDGLLITIEQKSNGLRYNCNSYERAITYIDLCQQCDKIEYMPIGAMQLGNRYLLASFMASKISKDFTIKVFSLNYKNK